MKSLSARQRHRKAHALNVNVMKICGVPGFTFSTFACVCGFKEMFYLDQKAYIVIFLLGLTFY